MRNAPAMHGNDHIPGGPDPIPFPNINWASGRGSLNNGTAGNDKSVVFVDITMETNAPDVFNIGTSDAPTVWGSNHGTTVESLQILIPGVFRIWATMGYDGGIVTGPNFSGAGFNDFVGAAAFLDETFGRGFNLSTDFAGDTSVVIYTRYAADLIVYEGDPVVALSSPGNVVPFGMAQNTLDGGQYDVAFLIYQLSAGTVTGTGDFSDITYLP